MARWASPAAASDASRSAAAAHDGSRAARRDGSSSGTARRLAYADPPYPGKSSLYYRDHPDFAGEVDHAKLLSRLATYDGWALSTSAAALPQVLALAVAQDLPVRVAAWTRGARPNATARYPVNAWEPVVYVPVPSRAPGERRVDVLAHGVTPLTTLPSRVIGAKPPAFCRWMLDLVGANGADTFDDLFPGSGIVGKTWDLYRDTSRVATRDVSREALGDVSRAAAVEHDGSPIAI